MRRIVTGHNDNGKSVIKIDGPPARSIGEEIGGLFEIWNEDGNTIDTKSSKDRADSDIILSPPSTPNSTFPEATSWADGTPGPPLTSSILMPS